MWEEKYVRKVPNLCVCMGVPDRAMACTTCWGKSTDWVVDGKVVGVGKDGSQPRFFAIF